MTRLVAMVGQGVASAKSPEIFNAWFKEHGVDAKMVRVEVAPKDLAKFVAAFRTDLATVGAVVTMPHKRNLMDLIDAANVDAKRFGVTNAIRKSPSGRIEGAMFDAHAFDNALREVQSSPAGKSIGIIGCGACGLACAWAALRGGAAKVGMVDLDRKLRDDAVATLRKQFTGAVVENAGIKYDIWVNASPVGSQPHDPSPISHEQLKETHVVIDVAAGSASSRLLKAARTLDIKVVDGRAFAMAQFEPLRRFILGE